MKNPTKKLFTGLVASIALLSIFATVALAATITGDDDPENLRGTNRVDTITANGGNDRIDARRGSDTIDAGTGDDRVYARQGADQVDGGEGNDTMFGGIGNDTQRGGPGNDLIYAGLGRDVTFGGDGNDTLWALARGDVRGRSDTRGDQLNGEAGDDTFRARDGEVDLISCGEGTDTAYLDFKDQIVDATVDNRNGSCENVIRKSRNQRDNSENAQ